MNIKQLPEWFRYRWRAGHCLIWIVSKEPFRIQEAVINGMKEQSRRMKEKAAENRKPFNPDKDGVQVWMHDKLNGFYSSRGSLEIPRDKTNNPLLALQEIFWTASKIENYNAKIPAAVPNRNEVLLKPPFDPLQKCVFVLHNWDQFINEDPLIQQALKSVIHSNMHTEQFEKTEDEKERLIRGQRMIVLITPTDKVPATMPELKPEIVPLPDDDDLRRAFENNLDEDDKPDEDSMRRIVSAFRGFTYQEAEDAAGLAIAVHNGLKDPNAFIATVEHEKSRIFAGRPGLRYKPRELIDDLTSYPGYEPLIEFLDRGSKIDPEYAAAHQIRSLKGVAIFGPPGGGKSRASEAAAKYLGRPMLAWNPAESATKWVGEAEAAARDIINLGNATNAVIGWEDIDKFLRNQASGQGTTQTTGNVLQIVLNEMSDPNSKIFWVFNGNRLEWMPPELLRRGRVNRIFFSDLPDALIRYRILQVKIDAKKFSYTTKELSQIEEIASDAYTSDWSGAELTELVEDAACYAGERGLKKLDFGWMREATKGLTPSAKTPEWQADIAKMREAAQLYTILGRTPVAPAGEKQETTSRRKVTRDE